jgi:putative restriction endonuclease
MTSYRLQSRQQLFDRRNTLYNLGVRFYVGVTDYDWFSYLRAQQADEVNFWQPSGNRQFRVVQPGEPFLFKLHSPRNVIAGGGYFSHFSFSPLSFAWDAFQEKNGAHSFVEMRERVWKYKANKDQGKQDEVIGCILLQQPFFFSEENWIPLPDWPRSIVQGKSFDTGNEDGMKIWEQVKTRLSQTIPIPDESVYAATQKFGKPQILLPRLGQGAFRMVVADSYQWQCALSSSHILHILDAAHIRPYKTEGGTHSPANGILLRQDIHTLFDRGYITVTPDYHVEVSKKIKEEFNNGVEYYAMHGKRINLPTLEQVRPSKESLIWHNEKVFLT